MFFFYVIAAIYIVAGLLLLISFFSLRRIPLTYLLGNLKARKTSLALSILGIGVVIAVMLSMKALDRGVELATHSSASKELLVVMREGAEAEISSFIDREATAIIRALPGIAKNAKGQPLVSPELSLLFKLPREGAPKGSNVLVRGVTQSAFDVRPYIKIVEGRMFHPASSELILSRRMSNRFNLHVGDTFKFGPQTWSIVG